MSITVPAADQSGDNTGKTGSSPAPTLTKWSVAAIAVGLLILAAFSGWVVNHYQTDDATNAATILGIVVPSFTTIVAAAFGVTVAYNTGKQQGNVIGQKQGQSAAAKQFDPLLTNLENAWKSHRDEVVTKSSSHAGSTNLLFGAQTLNVEDAVQGRVARTVIPEHQLIHLKAKPLDDTAESLAGMRALVDSMKGS